MPSKSFPVQRDRTKILKRSKNRNLIGIAQLWRIIQRMRDAGFIRGAFSQNGSVDDVFLVFQTINMSGSALPSRDSTVRHAGPNGDNGEYDPAQIFEMAYQLASMVAKRRGEQSLCAYAYPVAGLEVAAQASLSKSGTSLQLISFRKALGAPRFC